MLLVHLSGHSGAGKSRLLAASKASGLTFHRYILYTSRLPRAGEIDGREYYFCSEATIKALPQDQFIVYPVRQMVQAVDINALEHDLRSNKLVIVEMFHRAWPKVKRVMMGCLGKQLKTLSVFLTVVDPRCLTDISREEAEATIREMVRSCLVRRGRDDETEICLRADSAVEEISGTIGSENTYDRVILSAPEGQDGRDDWTRDVSPVGQAAEALKDFLSFIESESDHASV